MRSEVKLQKARGHTLCARYCVCYVLCPCVCTCVIVNMSHAVEGELCRASASGVPMIILTQRLLPGAPNLKLSVRIHKVGVIMVPTPAQGTSSASPCPPPGPGPSWTHCPNHSEDRAFWGPPGIRACWGFPAAGCRPDRGARRTQGRGVGGRGSGLAPTSGQSPQGRARATCSLSRGCPALPKPHESCASSSPLPFPLEVTTALGSGRTTPSHTRLQDVRSAAVTLVGSPDSFPSSCSFARPRGPPVVGVYSQRGSGRAGQKRGCACHQMWSSWPRVLRYREPGGWGGVLAGGSACILSAFPPPAPPAPRPAGSGFHFTPAPRFYFCIAAAPTVRYLQE